jgi:hypothetical protein
MIKSKKLGKKSQLFTLFIFLLAFLYLVSSYMIFSEKADKYSRIATIGVKQLDLFRTYSSAEKASFFIESSAKLSAGDSVYDLCLNGLSSGVKNDYYGFNLWSNESGFFNVSDNVNDDFVILFNKDLNGFLDNYVDVNLKKNNYKVSFANGLLNGKPVSPLTIKIGSPETSFRDIKLDYFPVKENYSFNNDWNVLDPVEGLVQGTEIFATLGTPVLAAVSGEIVDIGCVEGSGNRIGILDKNGNYFYYAHLDSFHVRTETKSGGLKILTHDVWKKGDEVIAGDQIGTVGDNIGCYADTNTAIKGKIAPHLHFGIYDEDFDGTAYNPYNSLQQVLGGEIETTFGTSGIYSIDSYFSIPFDSSLLNYSDVVEIAKNISDICSSEQDLNVVDNFALTDCINRNLAVSGWNLSSDCDVNDYARLEKENFDNCLKSVDNNCDCIISDDNFVRKSGKKLEKTSNIENECRINDRTFKICANTDKKVMAFVNDSFKLAPLTVRFALYVNDSSPPVQTPLSVECKNSEKMNVVLSFDESPSPDVVYYKVHYKSGGIDSKYAFDYPDFKVINLADIRPVLSCDMMSANDNMVYKDGKKFYYVLKLIPAGNYYLSIVGVDKFGNEVEKFSYTTSVTVP